MSMVERVARAIARGRTGMPTTASPMGDPYYDKLARAAIAAMREPTPEMLDAGDGMVPYPGMRIGHLKDIYTAMIDAALEG